MILVHIVHPRLVVDLHMQWFRDIPKENHSALLDTRAAIQEESNGKKDIYSPKHELSNC